MRSSPRSSWQLSALPIAVFLLTCALGWSLADESAAEKPGRWFVDALSERLAIREIPCEDPPELPGNISCARVDARVGAAEVFRAAHDEAMELAARELPVLDVRLPNGIPPNQLAELPGFEPVPDLPGLAHRLYLIGESRIGIWVDLQHREEEKTRIYFTAEELSGPFPDYFPAVEK